MSFILHENNLYARSKSTGDLVPIGMVASGADESLEAINTYASQKIAATKTQMDADAEAARDSIPSDYTDLSNTVDGLKEDLSTLNDCLSESSGDRFIRFNDGGYVSLVGGHANPDNPVKMDVYRYAVVPCNGGDIFSVSVSGGSSSRAYGFLDSNNDVIAVAPADTVTPDYYEITAPSNAVKLILNDYDKKRFSVIGKKNLAKDRIENNAYEIKNGRKSLTEITKNLPAPFAPSEVHGFLDSDIITLYSDNVTYRNINKESNYWSGVYFDRDSAKFADAIGFFCIATARPSWVSNIAALVIYVNVASDSNTGRLYSVMVDSDVTRSYGTDIKLQSGNKSGINIEMYYTDVLHVVLNGYDNVVDFRNIPIIPGNADLGYWEKPTLGHLTQEKEYMLLRYSQKVYYAFGDSMTYGSITDGDGSHLIGQSNVRYPEYFGERHNMRTYNYGVPGQGYLTRSGGRRALETIQTRDISNADLITLAFGLNDHTTDRMRLGTLAANNISTVLGQLNACLEYIWTQAPTCKVIVIGTTTRLGEWAEPVLVYGDTNSDFNTQGLNIALEAFCKARGVAFISNDGCGVNAYNTSLRCDATHFTEIGYGVWARYLSAQIASNYDADVTNRQLD